MHLTGDRIFALIVLVLVVLGIALFASAALGLLARTEGASPWRLAFTQLLLGLVPGVIALITIRFTPPKLLAKGILPLYIVALILTALVFVPGIGQSANGATRWINLGFTTIQPAEFIKIGTILMLSAYLAHIKTKIQNPRFGLLGLGVIVGLPSILLLLQPNTSTVLVIGATSLALYFLAGAKLRDIAIIIATAIVGLGILISFRPYLMDRVMTFVNPAADPLHEGYQVQQSLIAIGSGGLLGRGYGQSVQKFNYLPEPHGDSIFAVYGEEFGLLGTVFLVFLFLMFTARGFMIAADAPNLFGLLAATGLTLMISISAFMNMGAMLGVMPLTGLPLPFISHGGTALLVTLASVGVILNIAAHRPKVKRAVA